MLRLRAGDQVVFKVRESERGPGFKVEVSRAPYFLDLAGSAPTPADIAGKSWAEIREMACAEEARRREP